VPHTEASPGHLGQGMLQHVHLTECKILNLGVVLKGTKNASDEHYE
jgi:hypothetical protein